MCLDSDSLRYCMEPWNRAGRCFNLCSKQPQQSGIPAQEVQEATGAVRGRLWTHPVPRQSHDQTLPGAARSTARLRLQAGQIRPAAQHLTAGFSDAAFVKPLRILLPDLLSSLWFELICSSFSSVHRNEQYFATEVIYIFVSILSAVCDVLASRDCNPGFQQYFQSGNAGI